MAWEVSSLDFESFQYHQNKLAKIGWIFLAIFGGIIILQILIWSAILIFTFSGSNGFGSDTAKSFSQNLFTNQDTSAFISPNYQENKSYINYESTNRGQFKEIYFNSYEADNNTSTLKGRIIFEGTTMTTCIQLVKINEAWKVNSFDKSCDNQPAQ